MAFGTAAGGTPPDRVKARADDPRPGPDWVVPGQDFDASKLTADQLNALDEGARADALNELTPAFSSDGALLYFGSDQTGWWSNR